MANSIVVIGNASSSQPIDLAEASRASKQNAQGLSQKVSDASSEPSPSVATDLSDLGNFITSTAKEASSQSSIRTELVSSLKAQIATGTYRPDPNEVATRVAAAIGS